MLKGTCTRFQISEVDHWKFQGGGGSQKRKFLKESMNPNAKGRWKGLLNPGQMETISWNSTEKTSTKSP